jgi:uncharacterized protein YkwD
VLPTFFIPTWAPATTSAPTQQPEPATPTPAGEPTPTPGDLIALEDEIVRLTNEERAKFGLAPLAQDESLRNAAYIRANEISVLWAAGATASLNNSMRPDGTLWYTVFKPVETSFEKFGENVAWNFESPAAVMEAWMGSADHMGNILSTEFTAVGVGVEQSEGSLFWVQEFGTLARQ